jgi:hypothetical protein
MPYYSDELSAEDQLDAEEWIAATIFEETDGEVNEGECQELGQTILLEILSRFRPDLITRQ